MSALGAFTFVLHGHLPYMRLVGRWPHGEEWIHDAIIETYIPLLETLYDLQEEGISYRLTLGFSPVLAEQLADPLVLEHFERYLDERIEAAQKDMYYFENDAYDEHIRYLAEWYRDIFEGIKTAFYRRFNRDLIGAFRRLQDAGFLEIITSAATHAYLPLLSRDSSLQAQIKTAVASYRRLFGRSPRSFWLPEYAYRPAQITETGLWRPGLEQFLADSGFTNFFVDTHTLTGEKPVGAATGDVTGTYGLLKRRYLLPTTDQFRATRRDVDVFVPHGVGDSPIAALTRSEKMSHQVWGSSMGYPGDFDYRDANRRAGTSGLRYWRVTGQKVDALNKDYYHPDWAAYKIEQHAEHFAHLVWDQLRSYNQATGGFGLVNAVYPADLFGHWWFEGISWLGKVLRHLSHNPEVELTVPTQFVEQHPPSDALPLFESSWGIGGEHFLWDNHETHWMWSPIYRAEERMERLAAYFAAPTDDEAITLAQAARELLLMQSTDWPFAVTTGQARAYSIRRFSEHAERFDQLASSLEKGQPDADAARSWWQHDNIFADLDYRWFAPNT